MCKNNLSDQQHLNFDSRTPHEKTRFIFFPSWAIGLVTVLFAASVAYKIVVTDFKIVFDFSSFLSLLLALFSIFLAALFYFKATDTSNAFYDNTYKFTQEMSQLLSKIESGFGEKLTHLDVSYRGMVDQINKFPAQTIKDTEHKIESKEESVQQLRSDMDSMIRSVLDKAGLGEDERDKFLHEIRTKERELANAESTIKILQCRLQREKNNQIELPRRATSLLRKLIVKNQDVPKDEIFNAIVGNIPNAHSAFLTDLREAGLIDNDSKLTIDGEKFISNMIGELC